MVNKKKISIAGKWARGVCYSDVKNTKKEGREGNE